MQPSPVRDLIVGLFVALGLAAIAYLSIRVGGVSYAGRGGLVLHATFDQIGGLKPRAPVSVAGVTVGQVREISLDDQLRARVTLEVEKNLSLSVDSSAAIHTQAPPDCCRCRQGSPMTVLDGTRLDGRSVGQETERHF